MSDNVLFPILMVSGQEVKPWSEFQSWAALEQHEGQTQDESITSTVVN